MKGNICANCLQLVLGEEGMRYMRGVEDWSNKCQVCGSDAVFYARPDELKESTEKFKQLIK